MKIKYYKNDDILVLRFSEKAVDDSVETENGAILEMDRNKEPVSLEILHASKFFNLASRELPKEVKQRFFSV